jgi:hypothetical protein
VVAASSLLGAKQAVAPEEDREQEGNGQDAAARRLEGMDDGCGHGYPSFCANTVNYAAGSVVPVPLALS